jgi:hypothetical protein
MKTAATILLILLMLATLGVLFAGLLGFVRGGGDGHRSNALMRWRVLLQGGALVMLFVLLAILKD